MRNNRMPICAAMIVAVTTVAVSATAEIVTRSIEYEHDGVTLEGYLAYDDSIEGRRPGVLVVHEWWGLNDFAKEQARWLAEMGYVAFSLDMYGKGVLTDDPARARELAAPFYGSDPSLVRSRARAGLEVLRRQDSVDRDRIAAIGFCFGGAVVLQLAYSGAEISGVVGFHGSLPVPERDEQVNIRAKVLVLHGAEDPHVPEQSIARFMNTMDRLEVDWQMIYYGHAVHSFTNRGADDLNMRGVAFDENANRRSRQHMRTFFDELFAE
jgi:dienelactone hydrolase